MNSEIKPRKKVRRSRAEIETILSGFRQSGLTQAAFASQCGLNLGTFRTWLPRHRGGRRHGFYSVRVRDEHHNGFTIRLPGGVEISVCGGIDPRWVIALTRGGLLRPRRGWG